MEDMDPVELLRRQYLQCLDPESLSLPNPEVLRLPDTQSRMYSSMFDESRLQYAPSERYRFRVLKRVIGALEEAVEDPDEDVGLFDHLIALSWVQNPALLGILATVVGRLLSRD